MAFSDFKTIFDVANSYQTTLTKRFLFQGVSPMKLSSEFMEDLAYCLDMKKPNPSEIALSENLISPIIRYVGRQHRNIVIWSREYDLKVDDKLFGTPDYLFSYTEQPDTISNTMPLVCVSEAKVDNFTMAWGQTLAEMVACQQLYPSMTIYGFASNGEVWQFGMLDKNVFIQDKNSYSIATQAEQIAGLLNHIFTQAVQEAKKYLGKN
ncbi:MAG: hypothetical protein ACOVQA_14730 [Thermoflexibacteraceae bacterium]|jgi:hypothetical protein